MASKKTFSVDERAFFEQLDDACRGLIFISEVDSAIITLSEEAIPPSAVEAYNAGDVEDANIHFFDRLTKKADWQSIEKLQIVDRFAALRDLMSGELTDIGLVSLGKKKLDVYVIGKLPSGALAAIATVSVAT